MNMFEAAVFVVILLVIGVVGLVSLVLEYKEPNRE